MRKFINKLKIKHKLFIILLIMGFIFIYLGLQFSFLINNFNKQYNNLQSSEVFSDAVFEAKYFLRSDMHILLELAVSDNNTSFNHWWEEHNFQIMFFNDQINKIKENTFLQNNTTFNFLVTEIFENTKAIDNNYEKQFIPLFGQLRNKKVEQLLLIKKRAEIQSTDSLSVIKRNELNRKISSLDSVFLDINTNISDIGISLIKLLDNTKENVQTILSTTKSISKQKVKNAYYLILIIILSAIIISIWFIIYISNIISGPIQKIKVFVEKLTLGEHPENISLKTKDEIGDIADSLNKLTDSLRKTSDFSEQIGKGELYAEFTPLSDKDILGNSLLDMRENLKHAKIEEDKRHEEDDKRKWLTEGLAKFGDILRQNNDNLKILTFNIMSNLVKYMDAIQGAIFVINDENPDEIFFELQSAIAYGRDKLMQKNIKIGDGLVGRAAFEKITIYMTELPDNYINITSGLGDSNPKTILIVPLKLNDQVLGVIELASLVEIKPYQIEFMEQLGENIASIISSVKVNVKTAKLLEESKLQSEELAAQEEEMRQNMEELQATQEEASRREAESTALWGALNQSSLVVELEMDGRIINLNDKNTELIGVSKEQMIGKYHHEYAVEAKENPEWYKKFWSDLKKGITRQRLLHVELGGKDLWIHETYTPLRSESGEFTKVLNIGNDITNYKRESIELQKQIDEMKSNKNS